LGVSYTRTDPYKSIGAGKACHGDGILGSIEGVAMTREKPDYIEKSREAVWDAGERAIVKSLDATIEKLESSAPEITSESDEYACPKMVVRCAERTGERLRLAHALAGLASTKSLLMDEELSDSFRYYPPDFEKIDFDMARAHLLRTLEVKRCKDVSAARRGWASSTTLIRSCRLPSERWS
jgi:hypothetical protein